MSEIYLTIILGSDIITTNEASYVPRQNELIYVTEGGYTIKEVTSPIRIFKVLKVEYVLRKDAPSNSTQKSAYIYVTEMFDKMPWEASPTIGRAEHKT